MGLQLIKWLFPITIELIKGNHRFKTYTKRNLSIMFLGFAGLISMLLNLYLFEQASVYGALHKDSHASVLALTEKNNLCNVELKKITETKFVCPEIKTETNK